MILDKNCLVFYSRNKYENQITLKFAKENFDASNYFVVSDYPIGDFYIDLEKYDISDLTSTDWELINKLIDIKDVVFKDRLLNIRGEGYKLVL